MTTDVTAVALASRVGDGTGFYQTCSNAVGNLSIVLEPRSVPICNWSFTGTSVAPTEATTPTDALGNAGAAPQSIGTITLATDTVVMKRFAINFNQMLNGPNLDLASTTGVANPNIVGGIPTFSTTVEVPAFSTNNYVTDWTASTLTAFSIALGTGAGYVITITGKGVLAQYPQFAAGANGNLVANLSYRMDTAAGSPITIVYT